MLNSEVLSIRIEPSLKLRLEHLRKALELQTGGVRVTRAGVIKMLLMEGLKIVEARLGL